MECGTSTAHWTLSAGATFVTSPVNAGARALRCNPAASLANAQLTTPVTSANVFVYRFYLRFTTLPNATVEIATLSLSPIPGVYFKSSDSKIYAGTSVATLGATGVSVTTGQWYRIDVKVNISANPWTIDVQVDGAACGQLTGIAAATTASIINLGTVASLSTGEFFFDDVIISETSGDYPIGAGKVLGFVPLADGVHTFTGTHAILGTTGAPTTGANITVATTTAFGFVNARPIGGGASDSTRLWNQATASSAEYAEVTIEQTTEVNPPRAVEILCVAREASSTTCNSTFKVNDNGTEATVFAMTVPVGNSDDFQTKQFATMPADSAAWTLSRFNGLRLRWGYSSDATPDVYCRGWMIEAEFPTSLTPEAFGRPGGQSGQRQMSQLISQ